MAVRRTLTRAGSAARVSRVIAVAVAAWLGLVSSATAADPWDDPLRACDRAASRAETDWHLPTGLLAAIGIVESGRGGLASARLVAWPWSVNADGRGFTLPTKDAAIATVLALQSAGSVAIDVGCFQVDLFYHPEAFATLDAAFDPDINAQAAARILARARFGSDSWDQAIALYHSASPMRGAQYLRQVKAAWSGASTRRILDASAYVFLLAPAARQVRVITAADTAAPQAAGLPHVVGPQDANSVLQWTATPQTSLPIVLLPPARAAPGGPRR
jgi:hypothetical protein